MEHMAIMGRGHEAAAEGSGRGTQEAAQQEAVDGMGNMAGPCSSSGPSKKAVGGALLRMLHRKLSMAWEQWQQVCEVIRQQRSSLDYAMRQFMHRELATAFASWSHFYLQTKQFKMLQQITAWSFTLNQSESFEFWAHVTKTTLEQLRSAKAAWVEPIFSPTKTSHLSRPVRTTKARTFTNLGDLQKNHVKIHEKASEARGSARHNPTT